MNKVYIYNNWHNGDVITNRCLIKELIKYDLEIAVGSYRNRYYLVADLPVQHIVIDHDEDFPNSPCLSQFCPEGFNAMNSWCGTFPDLDNRPFPLGKHNWANIVDTWNRQAESINLNAILSAKETPMVDFYRKPHIRTRGRAIYVENGPGRSNHTTLEFDMTRIGSFNPNLMFYCTYNPNCNLKNVVDCSNYDLIDMSLISNQCEAIIGKGSGPFICTLTEINRLKPKAVFGFTSEHFWDYRDNPLQYLSTEQELFDFLKEVSNQLIKVI